MLEFYAEKQLEAPEQILSAMANMGTQLGRVLERKLAEHQVWDANRALSQRTEDLRRLASQLIETEQRERKRLSAVLHDDLQQLLVAARLRVPDQGSQDPQACRENMAGVQATLEHCLDVSRNLATDLSPPILQHGTLQVEDDGGDFDPAAVEALLDRPKSFGLFQLRERLEALGGRMEIRATPRGGARFRVILPRAFERPPRTAPG